MNKCLSLLLTLSGGILLLTASAEHRLWKNSYLQNLPLLSSLQKELGDLAYGLDTHERVQQEIQSIAADLEQGNCNLTAQVHSLFHLQQQHMTRLQEFGVPVFQSSAEFLDQCISETRYPIAQLPEEIRKSPALIALVNRTPLLCWTTFASDYSTVVHRIDQSCVKECRSREELLALREKLLTLRNTSMIPAQGVLIGSGVSEITGTEVLQTISRYDLLIEAVTSMMEAASPPKQSLIEAVLREMNRRDPGNSLRSKRELLHLFELVIGD